MAGTFLRRPQLRPSVNIAQLAKIPHYDFFQKRPKQAGSRFRRGV